VCSDGSFFTGVNVENSSFGLTVCAERVAIFKAVSEGFRDFRSITILSDTFMPYPCGACRQVMAEFCGGDFEVVVTDGKRFETYKLSHLLPEAFRYNRS